MSSESSCLTSAGKLFQAVIVEGKKEFEYRAVRENIPCKLSELRKLYLDVFPTFRKYLLLNQKTETEHLFGILLRSVFILKIDNNSFEQ